MIDGQHLNITVLYGGNSAEREVSLRSGAQVAQGLEQIGHKVQLFDTQHRSLCELNPNKPDLAFIMLHGTDGEDGVVQGALEMMGIPYTGCGVLPSALAMDKVKAKLLWQQLGLATPAYCTLSKGDFITDDTAGLQYSQQKLEHCAQNIEQSLRLPLMVKPVSEGSSVGMSKVDDVADIIPALQKAFEHDQHILVEQFISGAEYTVAIIDEHCLPSIRLQTPHRFYDYKAKYESQDTEYYCPSGLDHEKEQEIGKLALDAYKALGCHGWGRVDIMLDNQDGSQLGSFYLLEVNTVPGMTEKSLVPMAAKAAGMSFNELLTSIINTVRLS